MKYIIANWKMNMDSDQMINWFDKFKELSKKANLKNSIIIASPVIYLKETSDYCKKYNLYCSGQDVSIYERGAHTGDVGAFELKNYCQFCIVGHSERKEPRDLVNQKADMCLKYQITPIVCFVEKNDFVNIQNPTQIMCWEDPGNISKNGVYQNTDIENIKSTIQELKLINSTTKLLYGGSVNRMNIKELVKINDIDGVLVGNASLDPLHFFDIISEFENI